MEHHLKTGEKVTKENFKDIKKLYTGSGSKLQEQAALAMVSGIY